MMGQREDTYGWLRSFKKFLKSNLPPSAYKKDESDVFYPNKLIIYPDKAVTALIKYETERLLTSDGSDIAHMKEHLSPPLRKAIETATKKYAAERVTGDATYLGAGINE